MLETLKYVDGSLPKEDDPSITLEPITKKTEPVAPVPKIIDAPPTGPKIVYKAPGTVDFVVSTRKLKLRLPEGWSAENSNNEVVKLKVASLSTPIEVHGFSILDSDQPTTALIKKAAQDLNDYSSVTSREDFAPVTNKAGCLVSSVWRVGKSAEGDLVTGYATGSSGDFYFVLTYRQKDKTNYKADRKVLDQLLKHISIELVP